MRTLAVSLALATLGGFAHAQEPPRFEAADVHVSARNTAPSVAPFDTSNYLPNRMKGGTVHGDIFTLRTATMVDLIRTAWGVDADAVLGGPSWLESDRFDVIARVPADSAPAAVKPMLQALLAERFGLAIHNDQRPLAAFVLTAGKHQLLKAPDASGKTGCQSAGRGAQRGTPGAVYYTTYSCHNTTMAALAEALKAMGAGYVGNMPVLDRTGLNGAWDFDLKWSSRDSLATAGAEGISLFDAIDKQLGLKLELQHVPMPVIVVDRVNRKPADNPPDVAKSLPATPSEFDVADVKPSLAGAPDGGGVLPGGRIEMRGNTMKDFVKFAWNIDDSDDDTLVGGPKWLDEDRFDIVAKAFPGQSPTGESINVDALRPMMKALLADRFKLQVHSENQPVSVYALGTVSRNPKLTKADPASRAGCTNNTAMTGNSQASAPALTRRIECRNTTMAEFADMLRGLDRGSVDHPVIDATGLPGAWDFSVAFSPRRAVRATGDASAGAASDPTGAVSLFEALSRQLGLKLELKKHPMPVVVIDHVERTPSDN